MPLEFETVAIPVVKGIDVNTTARLVPAVSLLEAVNSRFPRGSGASKRRGHLSTRVRANKATPPGVTPVQFDPVAIREPFSDADPGLPSAWLWGWGCVTEAAMDGATALPTSTYPAAGLLFGATTRDDEALVWDGFRLFSRAPGQASNAQLPTHNAVMPFLRAVPAAKFNQAQTRPDCADNGRIRVFAWLNGGVVYYSVQDSATSATIKTATALPIAATDLLRVVNVGDWIHILAVHSADLLHRFSIHADTPTAYAQVSLGTCVNFFDLHKVSEESFVVARNTGTNNSTAIAITWHYANGALNSGKLNAAVDLGTQTSVSSLAIAVHPTTRRFALAWRGTDGPAQVFFQAYTEAGVAVGARAALVTDTAATRPITLTPLYLLDDSGYDLWDVYFDNAPGGVETLYVMRMMTAGGSTPIYQTTRLNLTLASVAFRVGNRSFIWAGRQSTYQSTWFLLDAALLPVGNMDYITAATPAPGDARGLASINWRATFAAKDRLVFHGALGYKIRVATEAPTTKSNIPVVYADPSIRFFELDFLPPLRAAQAGRSTYFAGAQLWAYDGLELTEASFPIAPEGVTGVVGGGGGLSTGDYVYRVDLCHRNGQNEEVRSASFYSPSITAGAGQKITVTIPTVITRRSDSYFLVFRNEANGAQWYLTSSRDPSSAQFVENDQSVGTVTFVDDGTSTPTDAQLLQRELHPGNGGFGYLDAFAAPACEIIAAGHDRLWLAGGEIPAGQVHPSRLYTPGETPRFNQLLAIQVDRAAEPITAIGFVGDLRAYFRKTQTYVHNGDGPDNSSQGAWEPVRLAYADVGAVSPDALGLITSGLLFQSPAGIRLLTPGGGLQPIGQPVDRVAKTLSIAAAMVCGNDQEVRFYGRDGDTLVYNYQYDIWSTWTIRAAGAVRDPDSGLALIATLDGHFWTETDGHWLDNGAPYKHRIRFAWLRAGNLMDFQRVRRIGALGECVAGDPHSIHVDVYYDEREFAEEWFDWDYPDPNTQNTDTFGAGSFGDGAFGDTDSD